MRTCNRPRHRVLATLAWLSMLAMPAFASETLVRGNEDALERIAPEQAGYSSGKLRDLTEFLEASGSESLLLLHDGKVFFEWGDIRRKRLVHSIRKALLNSLYGIHLGRGCLALDKTLGEFGIDDLPPVLNEREKSATLRQLLQSRSGVYHPAAAESEQMVAAKPPRGSHAPGEHYHYNNWDFNVAGTIFEQCDRRTVHEAFYEDIAKPLGMLDYRNRLTAKPDEEDPIAPDSDGMVKHEPWQSRHPAYHFRLSAHDLALYGQLFLDHGRWKGRQLVPSAWIDLSTRPYSIIDAEYGLAYGMLWNVLVPEPGDERASFYHTGADVHMLGVYPKHRLVLVHRVDTEREFRFGGRDLYRVIRMVHDARMPDRER